MVRENKPVGRRKSVTDVVLAEIVQGKSTEDADGYEELPHYNANPDIKTYVDFRRTETVKLCVIDLCVFQPDGVSTMQVNLEAPTGLIPIWEKYYVSLAKDFTKVIERYERVIALLPKNPSKRQTVDIESVAIPTASSRNAFKGKIVPSEKRISYGLKRIGRLNNPRATAMFVRFGQYSSRIALEVDIGKEQ